ncbi:hypothetical protein B0T22DRAFT_498024 [Podospora appendiculata]|uniref:NADH:flavin oxidoreductase/NADH oxidase N-terminal domain-containing protein n=1 Tax=Podospora appendiculata TaxID=314037 RepID=A0AAE0X7W9_9PEZI|nr:hypothetical protein B0T22DRAFT_498024 [Podospora appendiculata]
MSTGSRLFQPLTVGNMKLQHRIALAPLTRFRADKATPISTAAGGYDYVPFICTESQIAGWREVVDAVHAKGSYIYIQLWFLGRSARLDVLERDGFQLRSASNIPIDGRIHEMVRDYATAAKAGFDGVEIHAANGHLVDQFLGEGSNDRTDEYGGSVENRSRFAIEIIQAVTDAIGPSRTAIRLSPWSTRQSKRLNDPIPQFSEVIQKLNQFKLAYLSLVEARIVGDTTVDSVTGSLDFAVDLWDGPLLIAGGYTAESARRLVDVDRPDKDVAVAFGRHFIANPDLPFRVQHGISFSPYNRSTFYNARSPVVKLRN